MPPRPRVMPPACPPQVPPPCIQRRVSSGLRPPGAQVAETRDPSHCPRGRPQAVLRCLEGRALWAWLLPAPGAPRALGPSDGSGTSAIPLQSLVAPFLMPKPETPSWGGRGWPCCVLTWLFPPVALMRRTRMARSPRREGPTFQKYLLQPCPGFTSGLTRIP